MGSTDMPGNTASKLGRSAARLGVRSRGGMPALYAYCAVLTAGLFSTSVILFILAYFRLNWLFISGLAVLGIALGVAIVLAIELANPRHQHEHKVLKKYPLPDSMILIPGVIDSTTNYIEHPEVVADRICQAVEAVGDRSRVIAGTDCGFGTFAGWEMVPASIVWAKMKACSQGAQMASQRLWG